MKKNITIIVMTLVIIVLVALLCIINFRKEEGVLEKPLPAPELSEGLRGTYGIDKNINEKSKKTRRNKINYGIIREKIM